MSSSSCFELHLDSSGRSELQLIDAASGAAKQILESGEVQSHSFRLICSCYSGCWGGRAGASGRLEMLILLSVCVCVCVCVRACACACVCVCLCVCELTPQ